MINIEEFAQAVKDQLEPEARAAHTAATLKQLATFAPSDVTLADLAWGWQRLSAPQANEEPATVARRKTCGELAGIALQFTNLGQKEQAVKAWDCWQAAFTPSMDPRQAAMGQTFSRELAELQAE